MPVPARVIQATVRLPTCPDLLFRGIVPMVIQPGSGLNVGAACLRLNFPGGETIEEPDSRYFSFIGPCGQSGHSFIVDVDIHVGGLPSPDSYERFFDTGEGWVMLGRDRDRCILLQHRLTREPLWCALFETEPSRITVRCTESMVSRHDGRNFLLNPVTYPLDLLLLMYVLVSRRGMVIHCGGVNMGGKGLLLAGRSGAGKSTIIKCLSSVPETEALSDDRVIVRDIDGGLRMFGTPWLGTAGIGVNRDVPLKGIYFLCKGSTNEIRKLDTKNALERLLPVASVPWFDPAVVPALLELCGNVVAGVPAFNLDFFPGNDVGRMLADHAKFL